MYRLIQIVPGGGTLLGEIDATARDTVIDFITDTLTFPTYVTSTYSGLGVKFKITFQAIQNFIPDENGNKLENTIDNSLKIFNTFDTFGKEVAPLESFVIETINGAVTISPKIGQKYPSTLILPQTDANGNQITTVSSSFANLKGVTKLVIPSGYTTIEPGAFRGTTIESVDMSSSDITEIPEYAFFQCSSLTTVVLPEGLEILGKQSFYGVSVSSINLPSTLKVVESGSLWNTSLSYLYISASVELIDEQAIRSNKLLKIEVDDNNPYYYDDNNETLLSYSGNLMLGVVNYSDTTYEIPEGVVELFNYSLSFSGNLEKIIIPASLNTLGTNVFPSSITSFEINENNSNFLFINGKDLATSSGILLYCFIEDFSDYVIPDEIYRLNEGAFRKANVNTLTIGKGLTYIENTALSNSNIKEFVVDEDNTSFISDNGNALIGKTQKTFFKYSYICTNTVYTIHTSAKIIAPYAFKENDYIETVNAPDNVTYFYYHIFFNCSNLKNINMTSYVTNIYQTLFYNCPVEEITVYGKIGSNCFYNAPELKKVIFGDETISIDANCFLYCPKLETLVFESSTPPTLMSINIYSGTTPSTFKIYVPDDAVETYKTDEVFSYYVNKIYPVSELTN